MRKLLFMLLVVFCTGVMLVSCGGGEEEETEEVVEEEVSNEPSMADTIINGYTPLVFTDHESVDKSQLNLYITGTVTSAEEIQSTIVATVESNESGEVLLIINDRLSTSVEEYNMLKGKEAIFCGEYEGYSTVREVPVMGLEKLYVPASTEFKLGYVHAKKVARTKADLSMPENAINEAPENEEPKPEATEAPKSGATEAPKGKATEAPKNEATEAPKTKATEAPKSGATEAPKNKATEAPKSGATEAPKSKATEAPKSKVTEVPKGKAADTAEE